MYLWEGHEHGTGHRYPRRLEEGTGSEELLGTCWESHPRRCLWLAQHGCWELNCRPLGEQSVLLTTGPSLLTPIRHFICRMSLQKFSIFLVISRHVTSSDDRNRHLIVEVTVRSSHLDFLVLFCYWFLKQGIMSSGWYWTWMQRRRSLKLLTFHL